MRKDCESIESKDNKSSDSDDINEMPRWNLKMDKDYKDRDIKMMGSGIDKIQLQKPSRTKQTLIPAKDSLYLTHYEKNVIYAQKLQDNTMMIYRGKNWPANYLPPDEYEAEEIKEEESRQKDPISETIFG
jgi:hypothetical protein